MDSRQDIKVVRAAYRAIRAGEATEADLAVAAADEAWMARRTEARAVSSVLELPVAGWAFDERGGE